MSSQSPSQKIPEFLNFVATKKKAGKNWAFLHIKVGDKDINLDEIKQFLEFQFQKEGPYILNLGNKKELSLIVQDTDRKLAYIDKKIYETFPSDKVMAVTNFSDQKGIDHFSKLVSPHIGAEDIPAQISLRRLMRTTNSIMVLDDDAMTIRHLEHVLGGFGHITSLQDHKQFIEAYKRCAPDILFLDIHLRDGVRGLDLIEELYKIDPHAHVIVISADRTESTIHGVKTQGVKRFAVKPFDRNRLYKIGGYTI